MQITNRAEIERNLARLIGRHQQAELRKLLNLLGDPPRIENVPPEYWENGWRSLQTQIEPELINIYMNQAEAMLGTISVGVDWTLINTTAANWASTYTFDLVRRLTETTRLGLQQTIPRFYADGWNLGQLRTTLSRWFSPIRAESIAITETTRAAVEGEKALVDLLQKESGLEMIPIWQTNMDERVCPLCGPRHGRPITDGKFPPIHPRDRCWVTYEFRKGLV